MRAVSAPLSIVLATLCAAAALTACGDDGGDAAGPATDPDEFSAENLAEDDGTTDVGDVTTTTEMAPLDPTEIPGEPINQYDLDVRDCFDQIEDRRDGVPITITTRLPCDDPHHFEVFARLSYPAEHPAVFPGDTVVRDFALASCYREFEAWVGTTYETSELDIGVIVPTRDNFENDAARYRGIHCWVDRSDGEPMIGTSEGSGW